MTQLLLGAYPRADDYERSWRALASDSGARERVAGFSVEGRPIWRFEFGSSAAEAPVVLLTGLIHGVELIGSMALHAFVRGLFHVGDAAPQSAEEAALAEAARFVVMPIVNPDALAENMDRLIRGGSAWRRTNARGVDLNRNFPLVSAKSPWHPFAGTRIPFFPHYRGPHPLSEPESKAVHDCAQALRPVVAIGFHSFGNVLLYPWAFTRAPNPRVRLYTTLAQTFERRVTQVPYGSKQASAFYPTLGDLDDWLDAELGAVAFTMEVGGLDRRLMRPSRLFNPFCWMNPSRVEETVAPLRPGVVALLHAALEAQARR